MTFILLNRTENPVITEETLENPSLSSTTQSLALTALKFNFRGQIVELSL